MHTEKQIQDIVRAIDAVMVLGVQDLSGYEQASLEIDAISVYLCTQIASLKSEAEREQAMDDVASQLRIAVNIRLAHNNKVEAALLAVTSPAQTG